MEKQMSEDNLEPDQEELHELMIQKAHDLFDICDKENKGFINKRDMQRLRSELPLSGDQLDAVFDSLDDDKNGYLTLEEFTDGFGSFLGMKPQSQDEPEAIEPEVEEHDKHFEDMMDQIGGKTFFLDDDTVKKLWLKLQSDHPDLLTNFEHFLGKITGDISKSQKEIDTLEHALKSKTVTHDEEVKKLYEEMECQIKQERERILTEERLKEKQLKEEMESMLAEKERQLQEILQKQQEVESQLSNLSESYSGVKQQNEKLLKEKAVLEEEYILAQEGLEESKAYISQLREQQKNESRERARAALNLTEGIAMERESLVKQLDMLKDINKKLLDDKDEAEAAETRRENSPINFDTEQLIQTSPDVTKGEGSSHPHRKELTKQGSVLSKYFPDHVGRRTSSLASEVFAEDIDGHMADIEDDDIDCLYVNDSCDSYNKHNERGLIYCGRLNSQNISRMNKDHTQCYSDTEADFHSAGNSRCVVDGGREDPVGRTSSSDINEAQANEASGPERMFKVVFVGDSGVGKSSFIHQFCNNEFKDNFSATIGVDFQIKTLVVEGHVIALQLWDTAGQERFRSITKQYFRKADGVLIMYDVTSESSFISIRSWMSSVRDGVDDDTVIVLVGNKTEVEENRTVKSRDGSRLAEEFASLFFETSAKTGSNVKETIVAMSKILQEKEDRAIDAALKLEAQIAVGSKKRPCCS
ncbi:EF-hand calcium-binding domain-containing protein 4B-like isoform X2 [Gigantopelta aegis]|uniref:EF-hand calcium-binding domain-containing protein 4B-like isoform X2 n=1 Tax=Gigantopelta aegis TaxID=1735272 RepID=UPI001B88A3EC|nr:EF-hand calcium-binding domain-containing protein 4B-like isoform X2 [Gigantopelta aegis]